MSLFHNNALIGASGSGGAYNISRSLRFNSADSANCTKTAGTPTSSGTWTFSGWIKRATLGADTGIIGGRASGTATQIYFKADNTIRWYENAADFSTTAVFRDASSWYHFVFTKNGSTSCTIYVNGVQLQQNTTGIPSTSPLNASGAELYLGVIPTLPSGVNFYAGHYYADLHFIDGQALDPTSFGEFSATTGVWMPKDYTGTYGTNGFRLTFADNSAATATTLGKDAAGSNNWTPNNLSVTAGAGNDSLVDVPTNGSETDTGAGGQVRGNYATLNPLNLGASATLANGNLDHASTTASWTTALSTIGMQTGKWYFEATMTSTGEQMVGVANTSFTTSTYLGANTNSWAYYSSGVKYTNAGASSYGASYTNGDVIGVALDIDAGTVTFYKNGSSQGQAFSGLAGPLFFGVSGISSTTRTVNFGQRPFAYTAPSGFKALCTANLPAPLVTKPSTVMDVALYTGNGTARSITGLGFSPDMVWIKSRSAVGNHRITDIVRGVTKELSPDLTNAEGTDANGVTAFNSDGFSLGISSFQNGSGTTYAAWCWDAGSSTVTDNTGSIQSSRRTNATAGISVVTYNHGSGVGASTIGHGLGVAPSLILSKFRDGTTNWDVYVRALGPGGRLILNSTAAFSSETDPWNNTNPTSTVFSVGPSSWKGVGNHVAYCFAPVAGYSSFGSYIGNGSSDGPFVYTGFRPRWIMVKSSSVGGSPGYDWIIHDTARSTYNLSDTQLIANSSVAENQDSSGASTVGFGWDILSNGFKIRTSTAGRNQSGQTLIYAAFAESPFQYARAR